LGCFHILGIMNNAPVNMDVKVSILYPLDICPEVTLLDHVSVFLSFLRSIHNVFNLHSHQQYTKIPFSPYPHQYLLLFVFLMVAILTGVR
jgi:hypothetical protein